MKIARLADITDPSNIDSTVFDRLTAVSSGDGQSIIRTSPGKVLAVLSPTTESCIRATYTALAQDQRYTSLQTPATTRRQRRRLERDKQLICAQIHRYIAESVGGDFSICCSVNSHVVFRDVQEHAGGIFSYDANGTLTGLSSKNVVEAGLYCVAEEHLDKMRRACLESGHNSVFRLGDCAIAVAMPLDSADADLARLVDDLNTPDDDGPTIIVAGRFAEEFTNI